MKIVLILLVVSVPFLSEAQHKRMKKKESDAAGTLFGYWGYNQTAYSKSNIRFTGPAYEFTLAGVKATDSPVKHGIGVFLNPTQVTLAQYNMRIGYYFKDHWAVSLGYDHLKYAMADDNNVTLNGNIGAGVDTAWQGTYNAEPITINPAHFNYANVDGMNFMRIELTRTDKWFAMGGRDWFAISTNVGVSLGGVLTSNDFSFAGREDIHTKSLSGYGVALHMGPRFEFFKHVFFQPNFGAGFLHQLNVKNRPNDPSSYARHAFGYVEFDALVGVFLYIRPKNGCDSCPVW
jgi:hypothetical protein